MGVPIGTPCIYGLRFVTGRNCWITNKSPVLHCHRALARLAADENNQNLPNRAVMLDYYQTVSPELSAATGGLAAAAVVAAAVVIPVVAAAVATAAVSAAATAVAEEQNQDDDPPPVIVQTAANTIIVAHMITSASFR